MDSGSAYSQARTTLQYGSRRVWNRNGRRVRFLFPFPDRRVVSSRECAVTVGSEDKKPPAWAQEGVMTRLGGADD